MLLTIVSLALDDNGLTLFRAQYEAISCQAVISCLNKTYLSLMRNLVTRCCESGSERIMFTLMGGFQRLMWISKLTHFLPSHKVSWQAWFWFIIMNEMVRSIVIEDHALIYVCIWNFETLNNVRWPWQSEACVDPFYFSLVCLLVRMLKK